MKKNFMKEMRVLLTLLIVIPIVVLGVHSVRNIKRVMCEQMITDGGASIEQLNIYLDIQILSPAVAVSLPHIFWSLVLYELYQFFYF